MTIALNDLLLLLATASLVTLAAGGVTALRRVSRAAENIDSIVGDTRRVLPRIESTLAELEGELKQVRGITACAENVAADVEAVSRESRSNVVHVLRGIEALAQSRHTAAAIVGAKAGIDTLRSHWSGDDRSYRSNGHRS